jgi:arylsulfatase A-like enzyme
MLIKVPGNEMHIIDQATEFVDIFPTLCDLAGLKTPEYLSGESLRPYIEGKKKDKETYAFSQYPRDEKMGYAIRGDRYRYVEWHQDAKHVNPDAGYDNIVARQLFDYKYDPLEKFNIAGEDSIVEVQSRLAEELHSYYESLQD